MSGSVLSYVETRDGKILRSGFEAVRAGAVTAEGLGGTVTALAVGDGLDSVAPSLGGYGASTALLAVTSGAPYGANRWAQTLVAAARAKDADVVVIPATTAGKELAAIVAAHLDAACPNPDRCASMLVEPRADRRDPRSLCQETKYPPAAAEEP